MLLSLFWVALAGGPHWRGLSFYLHLRARLTINFFLSYRHPASGGWLNFVLWCMDQAKVYRGMPLNIAIWLLREDGQPATLAVYRLARRNLEMAWTTWTSAKWESLSSFYDLHQMIVGRLLASEETMRKVK